MRSATQAALHHFVVVGAIAAVGLATGGCGEEDPKSIGASGVCDATLASVSTVVFASNCTTAGCHAAAEPAAGLDLESPGVESRLLEQPASTCDRTLVVPGDPDRSLLYEKVASSAPQCGDSMPIGAPLAADRLGCLRDWIAALPTGCETCGGGGCADLQGDPANCGDCGVVCPAGATCEQAACACAGGRRACADSCVDTISDPEHCGTCGNACNGMLVCSLGECKSSCDGALAKCGSSCVDLQTDPENCSACGVACGAIGTCIAGECSCGPGIDVDTDPQNCGACGAICAPGQTCAGGECTCGTASVSFSAAIQPFFTATCATTGCHKGVKPQEGLDLSTGNSHGELVEVPATQCNDGRVRVLPGDPSASYLVDKMLGVDLCFGTKMPKMGTVAAAEVETISNWICGGALSD